MAEPETQAVAKRDPRPLEKAGFAFLPKTWEELYAYAKEISQTEFVPDAIRGKPGAVLAAWQKGQEVGLPPMAALQSIAIIKGRPSIHSAGYWALIKSHPLCESTEELGPDDTLTKGYGECTVKRRGAPNAVTRRFTIDMAKTAGLWGGTGDTKEKKESSAWFKYPGRMLQMRARHIAGDDAIPEAAQGLLPADVAEDLEPRDVTPQAEPLKVPQAIDDGGTSESDSQKTVADKPTQVAAEKTAADRKKAKTNGREAALQWVAEAPDAEIMDNNGLNSYLKGLKQDEQLEVCRAYNARRQEIVAEMEKGNAANAG